MFGRTLGFSFVFRDPRYSVIIPRKIVVCVVDIYINLGNCVELEYFLFLFFVIFRNLNVTGDCSAGVHELKIFRERVRSSRKTEKHCSRA